MKIFNTTTTVKMFHDDELINGEDYSNMPGVLEEVYKRFSAGKVANENKHNMKFYFMEENKLFHNCYFVAKMAVKNSLGTTIGIVTKELTLRNGVLKTTERDLAIGTSNFIISYEEKLSDSIEECTEVIRVGFEAAAERFINNYKRKNPVVSWSDGGYP